MHREEMVFRVVDRPLAMIREFSRGGMTLLAKNPKWMTFRSWILQKSIKMADVPGIFSGGKIPIPAGDSFREGQVPAQGYRNRSAITKQAKMTDAMPFRVAKARLTRDMSSGLTTRCS